MVQSLNNFNLKTVHHSWLPIIRTALEAMDIDYLTQLKESTSWLPGHDKIFNAFSFPINKLRYILFGESPYPRKVSANGYAFWDASVHEIWSDRGLSTKVNRATSLRNIVKMLLVARNDLQLSNTTQNAITKIDKTNLIQTIDKLFEKLINEGFLLLNASLVLSQNNKNKDAKSWLPFIEVILKEIYSINPNVKLLLFGQIAKTIDHIEITKQFDCFYAEHPYNLSFITNPDVLNFFRDFDLLAKKK